MPTGETFTHTRSVDPYRPIYYAAASGDFNPIHIDPAFAQAAGLPGPVLHGLCTLAWLLEGAAAFAGAEERIAAVHTRFSRPVCVGDDVRFTGTVGPWVDGLRTIDVETVNQRGEAVLREARVVLCQGDARPAPRPMPAPLHDSAPYGPSRFAVEGGKVQAFIRAVGEGIPSELLDDGMSPVTVAPPAFAALFALRPCVACTLDPALGVDVAMLLHGAQSFTFHAPVAVGDVLETTGVLVARERREGRERLTVETVSTNQHGQIAVRGTFTAVVRS